MIDPAGGDTLSFNNRYLEIAPPISRGFGGWIPAIRVTVADVSSSVNTPSLAGEFSVYPNPADGASQLRYNFEVEPKNGIVEIFSMTGQKVHSQLLLNGRVGTMDLPVNALAPGMYNVRLSTTNGERTLPLQVAR